MKAFFIWWLKLPVKLLLGVVILIFVPLIAVGYPLSKLGRGLWIVCYGEPPEDTARKAAKKKKREIDEQGFGVHPPREQS